MVNADGRDQTPGDKAQGSNAASGKDKDTFNYNFSEENHTQGESNSRDVEAQG